MRLLLVFLGLLLAGCATNSATRAQKSQLTQAAQALQLAMNSRSVVPLSPYLTPDMQLHGMPPSLSAAGLRSGAFWPSHPVDSFQVYEAKNTPSGAEARVSFDVGRELMLLKLGLDPSGRIRFIDNDEPWWAREASVSRPFTSDIVISDRLMFVRGSVNGIEGFFLLDTGASTLLLNQKYFTPSGDDAVPGLAASVAGIKKRLGRADVSSLRWGGLRASDITGELHDFSAMERAAVSPLLGAISHNELKSCALVIDWRQRKVQVIPTRKDGSKRAASPGRPPDILLGFSYFSFMPVVDVQVGPKKYALLFDSGASMNVLPNTDGLGPYFRHPRPVSLNDTSRGTNLAAVGGIVNETRIGGAMFRDMPFVIYDTPYLSGRGFLGVPLLERCRMEINFPARQIALWR